MPAFGKPTRPTSASSFEREVEPRALRRAGRARRSRASGASRWRSARCRGRRVRRARRRSARRRRRDRRAARVVGSSSASRTIVPTGTRTTISVVAAACRSRSRRRPPRPTRLAPRGAARWSISVGAGCGPPRSIDVAAAPAVAAVRSAERHVLLAAEARRCRRRRAPERTRDRRLVDERLVVGVHRAKTST